MKKKRPLHHKLLQIHRWTGLLCAVLVLVLSITGIALEHTDDWQLDQRYIASNWLLQHYGIQADPITHYSAGEHSFSHSGNQLYFDQQRLEYNSSFLCGAQAIAQGFALCVAEGVLLLDTSGAVIEILDADITLPAPATGLGLTSSSQLVLLSHDGNWLADADMLLWQEYTGTPSQVSKRSEAGTTLSHNIQQQALAREISWERLLLDLHSGRLFGRAGIYVMDIAAIALIYLALSGIWVWWKRR